MQEIWHYYRYTAPGRVEEPPLKENDGLPAQLLKNRQKEKNLKKTGKKARNSNR